MSFLKKSVFGLISISSLMFVVCTSNNPVSTTSNEGLNKVAAATGGSTINYGNVKENQEFAFILQPGDVGFVNFRPWKSGKWKCYVWHSMLLSAQQAAGVSYLWTDFSKFTDTYHLWATGAAGYGISYKTPLASTQIFSSGSAGIGYQIQVKQWSDYMYPIHILIIPN